jgi:hypothetical protein
MRIQRWRPTLFGLSGGGRRRGLGRREVMCIGNNSREDNNNLVLGVVDVV